MTDKPTRLTRRRLLGVTGAALLCPSISRAATAEHLSGQAFGTTWQVRFGATGGAPDLADEISALFAEVDHQMSPYRADSTLSLFNRADTFQSSAPAQMRRVTEAALDVARQSHGFFDPTVGPLVAQWGFGPIVGTTRPDWRDLSLNDTQLIKNRAEVTLDLCGIAKGWSLDQAMNRLGQNSETSALFDLGGELSALGHHPSGRAWQVGIEQPIGSTTPQTVLRLPSGFSVATSGTLAQSYQLADKIYGHIIDPGNASPAQGPLVSVSVIAESAMIADAWATALFAAGEKGPELAQDLRIDALFQSQTASGLETQLTGNAQRFVL